MRKLLILVGCAVVAIVLADGGVLEKIGWERSSSSIAGDDIFASAFAAGRGNFVAEGSGTVTRILPDDGNGSRHQRFIVQLSTGQTLLISHNIDLAPRVEGLSVGAAVAFKGEYEWNDKGGVMHWTHRDPAESHEAGWIRFRGTTYQ